MEKTTAWTRGYNEHSDDHQEMNPFVFGTSEYKEWEAGWRQACDEMTRDYEEEVADLLEGTQE